jgi:MYXO-CTERM domain-containing protein
VFSTAGGPEWVMVNAGGALILAPPLGTHGRFLYAISLVDGYGGNDTREFTVNVSNEAPAFRAGFCGSAFQGYTGQDSRIYLKDNATDADDPENGLQWSLRGTGAPNAQAALNSSSGVLQVTFQEKGTETITVVVTDLANATAECTFTLMSQGQPPATDGGASPPGNSMSTWIIVTVALAGAGLAALLLVVRRRHRSGSQ